MKFFTGATAGKVAWTSVLLGAQTVRGQLSLDITSSGEWRRKGIVRLMG